MSLVSIVIPTYNRPDLLKEAIGSVQAQTYKDWELIIVDDGSSPKSETVVLQFNDTRIRYAFQKNQGRSTARNLGIEKATGKYIAFLDDDDIYDASFCQAIFDNAGSEDAMVFSYKMSKLNNSKTQVYKAGESAAFLKLFANKTYAPSAFVIKKDSLGPHRFTKEAYLGEDFRFFMEFLISKKLKTIDSISSIMRSHKRNTTNSKYEKYKESVYQQLRDNVLNIVDKNQKEIGISDAEFKQMRDAHLLSLVKGHAMYDMKFANKLVKILSKDYPDFIPPTEGQRRLYNLKGSLKGLLRF